MCAELTYVGSEKESAIRVGCMAQRRPAGLERCVHVYKEKLCSCL